MPFKKKISDLLVTQQAEIERLQLSNESLNEIIGDLLDDWSSAIEKAKSEAVKDFADRIHDEGYRKVVLCDDCVLQGQCIVEDTYNTARMADSKKFCAVGKNRNSKE